jgi:EAL domain-containing protein (putative c-di-GMP-specific phosphodiesterase class I)
MLVSQWEATHLGDPGVESASRSLDLNSSIVRSGGWPTGITNDAEYLTYNARPASVVVVDDHEIVRDAIGRIIERASGLDLVGLAGTAEGSLELARDLRPDLVIMDYGLPDGDGAQAAADILTERPDTKVIMLTGSDVNFGSAMMGAVVAGCAAFVGKTAPQAELVRVIRSVLSGRIEIPEEILALVPRLDDLVAFYQPIVNLTDGRCVGFEALVRWNHPDKGILPPAAFLPLAERTPLVSQIDDLVRSQAFEQLKEWSTRSQPDPGWFISVNVSGHEFETPGLTSRIMDSIDEWGIPPEAVLVEITETVVVENRRSTSNILHQLRDYGVRIALDDFGTGYSSLSYLRQFPIDVVKLDKSFTDDLPGTERTLQMVRAFASLAGELGVLAEAEGIETEEQAQCLVENGWPLGQGFYFSRPLPSDEITEVLDRGGVWPAQPIDPSRDSGA